MIRRNWKSWLLAIPAWALGIAIGFLPAGGILGHFIDHPNSYEFLIPNGLTSAQKMFMREQVPFYIMYTLGSLVLMAVIYLAHKHEMKWTAPKIAFILGLYTLTTIFILFLKTFDLTF